MLEFQTLTLAVVPLVPPVIISLNANSPVPLAPGSEILIVGAVLYPKPELVILIAVISPEELTTAVAAAETVVTPDLNTSLVKVIVGDVVYPPPPDETVTIPIVPSPIVLTAVAPVPVALIKAIFGATVYPAPALDKSTC